MEFVIPFCRLKNQKALISCAQERESNFKYFPPQTEEVEKDLFLSWG